MTPDEINKRIALFCKWKQLSSYFGGVEGLWEDPNGKQQSTIPNYYGDLNTMHDAEKTLDEKQERDFVFRLLIKLVDGSTITLGEHFTMVHATAPQRAEAFLRTIGQWDESE